MYGGGNTRLRPSGQSRKAPNMRCHTPSRGAATIKKRLGRGPPNQGEGNWRPSRRETGPDKRRACPHIEVWRQNPRQVVEHPGAPQVDSQGKGMQRGEYVSGKRRHRNHGLESRGPRKIAAESLRPENGPGSRTMLGSSPRQNRSDHPGHLNVGARAKAEKEKTPRRGRGKTRLRMPSNEHGNSVRTRGMRDGSLPRDRPGLVRSSNTSIATMNSEKQDEETRGPEGRRRTSPRAEGETV